MFTAALIILSLVVAAAIVYAVRSSIIVVHEGQQAIVLRFGKFDRVAPPGPAVILPFVEEHHIVPTGPRRYVVPAAGFTRDGVRVAIDVAVVTKVVDPRYALRHARSIDSQSHDAAANAVANAIAGLTTEELLAGGERLVADATAPLDAALGAIGLATESLRVGAPQLPADYAVALAGSALALRRRDAELLAAHTDKATREVSAAARADELAALNRVARRLHPNALAVERLETLRAVAAAGGQITVFAGTDDDVRPAVALPPPIPMNRKLRDVS